MASPDKTPPEERAHRLVDEYAAARDAEVERLEAVVVRLQQERDKALARVEYLELIDFRATAAQWEGAFKGERAEVVRLREAAQRLVDATEGQEFCFCCGEGLTQDNPQQGHEDLPDGSAVCDYLTLRRLVSPDKPPEPRCDNCRGKGWLDENGVPTVPGRSDSYECQECGGSGVAVGGEQE